MKEQDETIGEVHTKTKAALTKLCDEVLLSGLEQAHVKELRTMYEAEELKLQIHYMGLEIDYLLSIRKRYKDV